MNPVLILNGTNYNNPNSIQGKRFSIVTFASNYPLDDDKTISGLGVTTGSKYITAISGFEQLLGCDMQNNNKVILPFLACDDGSVLEIDYIESDTRAVLKAPSSYTSTADAYPFNTLTPAPISTVISDATGAGAALVVNTKFGPGTSFTLLGDIEMGSSPILVAMTSDLIITITY